MTYTSTQGKEACDEAQSYRKMSGRPSPAVVCSFRDNIQTRLFDTVTVSDSTDVSASAESPLGYKRKCFSGAPLSVIVSVWINGFDWLDWFQDTGRSVRKGGRPDASVREN